MAKTERPPRPQSTLGRKHPAAARRTDTAAPGTGATPGGEARTQRSGSSRAKMTINTTEDLIDAAKDAWYATTTHTTFSAWVATALWTQIEADRAAAGVEEFPRRPTKRLPAGRPAE